MNLLFTISGSSGSGKTTLLELLSRDLSISISVSHTTREQREYEIDGVHYHFITKDEFDSLVAADKFIEYENVHGDFYGTTKDVVEDFLQKGKPLFLNICNGQEYSNVAEKTAKTLKIPFLNIPEKFKQHLSQAHNIYPEKFVAYFEVYG